LHTRGRPSLFSLPSYKARAATATTKARTAVWTAPLLVVVGAAVVVVVLPAGPDAVVVLEDVVELVVFEPGVAAWVVDAKTENAPHMLL